MASKHGFWESLICWTLLISFIYFFFVHEHMGEFRERQIMVNQYRVKGLMKDGSGLVEQDFKKQGRVFPGFLYWGPLTGEMLRQLGGDAVRYRDPFNDESKERALNYFTNGTDFWALISRGPDARFELTSATLMKVGGLPYSMERMRALAPFLYDPSNGTASAGDIVRINE